MGALSHLRNKQTLLNNVAEENQELFLFKISQRRLSFLCFQFQRELIVFTLLSGFAHNRLPCCGNLQLSSFDVIPLLTLLMAPLPSPTLKSWVVRSSHIPGLFNSERVSFSMYLLIYVHSFALASEL